MKYITNKKKNSQNDHSSYEFPLYNGPNGPIHYEPLYKQPEGVSTTCHLCNPPMHFKKMEDGLAHTKDKHRVWKG